MVGSIGTSRKFPIERIGGGRFLGGVLLLAFLGLRLWDPAPLELVRLKFFDIYQLAKPREVTSRPVVIVDIDEASLEEFGQWPWPRDLLAKLIDQVMAQGAVAIAFDMVFAEPDRTSPNLIADALPELSEQTRQELRSASNHDAIMAASLRRSRVVLGQSAYNPRGLSVREDIAPKVPLAYIGQDPGPYLLTYPELLPNIRVLEDAATGRGMFGCCRSRRRRAPRASYLESEGQHHPIALDRSAARRRWPNNALDQKRFDWRAERRGTGQGNSTDINGQLWINFSPHDPGRYVSAKDVIAGSTGPGRSTASSC